MPRSIDERVSYLHQRDPSIDRRFRPRPVEKFNLYNAIKEDDKDSTSTSEFESVGSSVSSTSETEASVYLRLKPTTPQSSLYRTDGQTFIVQNTENGTSNNKDTSEKHFEFTKIFEEQTSQSELYNNCVAPYIEAEEDLTVLTYGTSGSGKTFTMHGTETDYGIIQRAIEQIFCHYKGRVNRKPGLKIERGNIGLVNEKNLTLENALRSRYTDWFSYDEYECIRERIYQEQNFGPPDDYNPEQTVCIWVSFAEIYNENVYDLLDIEKSKFPGNDKRKILKVISNDGNAFIKDLTTVHVRSAQDAHAVLRVGLEQVQFASTNVNRHSSRSHCIFIIDIVTFTQPDDFTYCSYKFCDLAGSERLKKTENVGQRLKEAQRINTSLLVLGRCLDATYQNQQHKHQEVVPFRESKLTTLLQAPLLGHEKILTIVNMCPSREFIEENLNVLHFSSMAHKIVYSVPKQAAAGLNRSRRYSWFLTSNNAAKSNDTSTEISYVVAENIR